MEGMSGYVPVKLLDIEELYTTVLPVTDNRLRELWNRISSLWVQLTALQGKLFNKIGSKTFNFGVVGMVIDMPHHL